MSDIISSITTILTNVWTLMDYNLLPGISIKEIFLFTWITGTMAMFFRVFVFGNMVDQFDDD